MSEQDSPTNFDYLPQKGTISLTTFYRSGKGVATPVDSTKHGDKLYANTRADSYKVKRLKHTSRAVVAPCKMSGKITGPSIEVSARVLPEEEEHMGQEAMKPLMDSFFWRLGGFLRRIAFWRTPPKRVFIEISLPNE